MTPAQRKLKRLKDKMGRIRHEYNEACKEAFPVGTEVAYAHGDNLRRGVVIDVGYGHRLKIKHPSGAAPWIDAYRVIDELE